MERKVPNVFLVENYADTLAYVNLLLSGQPFTPPSPLIASNETFSTIDLNWANVSADNYILYRATQSDYSDAAQIYSGSLTTFQDTGLTEGTTYYYRVKSQKAGYIDSVYATASGSTSLIQSLVGSISYAIAFDNSRIPIKSAGKKQIGLASLIQKI